MSGKRRALISVANKQGIIPFARGLLERSFEIISTGGTASALRAAGIPVTEVSAITGFPEIMDGRVKTLHPRIHGGLLGRPGYDDEAVAEHGIGLIDVLVVNLYPFEETIARPNVTAAEAIENIDVGGPAMLRAAAKNHERVTVVIDEADYPAVLEALRKPEVPAALRRDLAAKAFAYTARYDAAISGYLRSQDAAAYAWPDPLMLSFRLAQPLRYGENPHQKAALYRSADQHSGSVGQAAQVQGKELSFNNLADADAALQCVSGFETAACVIVKHANPCGVAIAAAPDEAYRRAYRADPTSAFGGVLAFNRILDESTAEAIVEQQFAEVVVAPEVAAAARSVLARKPAIRVLEAGWRPAAPPPQWDTKTVEGGLLLQERDVGALADRDLRTVTQRAPSEAELADLRFAWAVVKFVKSNAIVYARDGATLGIGAGQASRVMSARIAALKASEEQLSLEGAVMASDAFFPFRDGIDTAAEHGIRAVIHPGGSVRDAEVIRAADEHDIAMVLTGMRHFRH
ncbi:MAG TPA: bifunctional phosphoribosylaminoimidazolecarboxamide formyltransferase/IMP cyclohydrolase [Gammaproteobacteria bacterium]|nr:bifunctional phosphoribosylaminoimidazolecarboxamide formyltransferase/IMP cyclohydrolase [Gammaproteobacteria bacterium]